MRDKLGEGGDGYVYGGVDMMGKGVKMEEEEGVEEAG